MTIQKVEVNTRSALVTCVSKTTDAGDFQEIEIGEIFKHQSTGLSFKVTNVDVTHNAGYTIMNVILVQVGSWHKRIKSSVEAKDLLFENLIKITDKEELKSIERASCYC